MNIRIIAQKIGLDKSIAYSSGARVVQAVAGVGSIFFIGTFLSAIEQGFFFTFNSILALQVFFELGLTGIMTQYVAHEVSHLELNEEMIYIGEQKYKSRLASLVQFCIKWYAVISVVVFIFLILVGYIYFIKYGDSQKATVDWRLPWVIICLATALKLFISPFAAILTGLGFVKEQSKIIFYQQLIQPVSIWLGLILGAKLYIVGVGYLISVFLWIYMSLTLGQLRILRNILKISVSEKISYMKEIFPYQWKIALSWVSGYFTFQMFNPVLFAIEGATIAGQMGMTLQALNAISAFSMSWLNTKIPYYSRLIALRKYDDLDRLFNKTLLQMVGVCSLLLLIFFFTIVGIREFNLKIQSLQLADRFLDYIPLLLLMSTILIQQFINSWATYLRCHKQEPFLILSICSGVFSLVSTLILGNLYGLYGVLIGYVTIMIITGPLGYIIFKEKKYEWHK